MNTLVIDVGTSGVRAAVIDDTCTIHRLTHRRFIPNSPAPGLVEFDADALWDAVVDVALAACESTSIDAVGLTNQRASTIGWRRSTGQPIGPALGWQDLRTVGDCIVGRSTHGYGFAPNQSATKVAWLLSQHCADNRHDDDLCFGTVDTWLIWKLTHGNTFATDHTNAAVTGLTTADGRSWNPAILSALDIAPHHLADIRPTMGSFGDAVALPGAPPVTAAVGDQQASLVGQGCIHPGQAKITFGTGAMFDMVTGTAAPTSAVRTSHGTFPIVASSFTDPTNGDTMTYGVEAIMLSAGTNIEWLVNDLGLIDDAASSDTVAARVATTDGVAFVPALLGLGTPHWDYGARGSFFGLTRGTTASHMVRAVLEGVAHRGVDLIEAAEHDTGRTVTSLSIDGGMSRNNTFVHALADAAQRSIKVSHVTEATTIGAGVLAGVAAGQWPNLETAVSAMEPPRVVDPLGSPGLSRQQWSEAVSRARAWIPDLSALDF